MIFPNLLLRFLFGFTTLAFAAGTVAITEGGGGEAPVTTADDGAGGGEGDEGAGAGEGAAEGGAEDAGGEGGEAVGDESAEGRQAAGGEDKIDWRTIPQAVRAHLQEIKKTDPKLANLIQNAVYTSQSLLKAVPGGLKEIQSLKQVVDEAGGAEEIRSMRETHRAVVEEQEDLDRRAMAGDVSVLDNFAEIAGEGFSKLMPAALDRWMQKAPAEYSHAMAGVMVAALNEGGVVSNLNMAIQLFGLGTPESIKLGNEALTKATEYLNSVGKIASTVPQKAKVDPQIAQQQTEIDNDRTKIFNDRFADRFTSWRNPAILQGLTELAPKGKQFTEYQKTVFVGGVVDELRRVLTSDDDYTRNLERIYNTRNLDDLFRFAKSRSEKLIPDARKKVYRQLFSEGTLGTKKPVTTTATVKPTGQGTAQPVVKGWVKVSQDKAPAPTEIDLKASPFEMRIRKAAILKDGRKVYWGDKAPA